MALRKRWWSKFGAIEVTGLVFLLLTILVLWLSVKNFWTYSRMRSAEMAVTASSLRIDLAPSTDSEYPAYLIYILTLDLRSVDGSDRQVRWSTDAGKAAYPEEALDVLAAWAPGTRHKVQMIRGDSRDLRIDGLESNPELEKGFGGLFAAAMFGVFALAALAGMADENKLLQRFAWRKHFGVWMVFFGFGLAPLTGWGFFTFYFVKKMATWPPVTAQRIEQNHKFVPEQLPPGVELTQAAKAKLESASSYDLIEYAWAGGKVHGAIGSLGGVHDQLAAASDGRYLFRIDPRDRWDLSQKLGWNSDFAIPFVMLLFFGVTFCGVGLFIRKSGL